MSGLYNDAFVNRLSDGLKTLLPQWEVGAELSVALLTVSENATFLVTDKNSGKKTIFRVHRPHYHTQEEVLSELHWVESLREQNIVNTPEPLRMKNGELMASFLDDGIERYVVAFEFMPGQQPSEDASLVQGFELLGATSAKLHQHASEWTLPDTFIRKTWNHQTAFGDEPLWGKWQKALGLDEKGKAILQDVINLLEDKLHLYGDDSDRFGLVHADLRLANLLSSDQSLGVIDFDDCGFSWFMYDFASAVSFLEDSPLLPELQQAWIKGYQSVTELAEEHQKMLPTFVMFRRLLLTAWVAGHSETETAREAGLEKYTQGTIQLALDYMQQQGMDIGHYEQLSEKGILDMNAFQANVGGHKERVKRRLDNTGAGSVLFYQDPIEMVSAKGCWVTAADGKRYLDFYNNVPTLGHCHPNVVKAVSEQIATLNIHTRYLVDIVDDYIEALKSTLPASLSNVAMTCSGSEANDLALRLAKKASGGTGFIVTEEAYHGNTSAVTEVSPSIIKKGGLPKHIVTIAPPSKQAYGDNIALGFAAAVRKAIATLELRGVKVAALLVDSVFSSDGIFIEPKGVLKQAVEAVREAGGVFICDEVQPGFARLGEAFWGFEYHGVEPDIVTMGKPMGNGFPMAAVATRPAYLASFCEEIGYFNTFGGNPLAAAAGLAVLNTIQAENLQKNASEMGQYLKTQLQTLAEAHPCLADVRGLGLFIGVDICKEGSANKQPDPEKTREIINSLRESGVLAGAAGKYGATIKLRPPLSLKREEADVFLAALAEALSVQVEQSA